MNSPRQATGYMRAKRYLTNYREERIGKGLNRMDETPAAIFFSIPYEVFWTKYANWFDFQYKQLSAR